MVARCSPLIGQGTRGLVMGVWGTHQYLGNIIGLAMAAAFADEVNNNNDNTSTILFRAFECELTK